MTKSSYSTAGFKDRDLEAALDGIAAAGFPCIEVAAVPHASGPPSGQAAAEVRRQIERRQLLATTLHAPPGYHVLGAPTEDWRQEKVKVLADHLLFAGEIGASGVIIHPIPNPIFLPEGADIKALLVPMEDAVKRSLDELIPVAAEAGVRMLLENLPYALGKADSWVMEQAPELNAIEGDDPIVYPLIAMHQLRPFVDAYPPEQVGLVVDTGHAWTSGIDPVSEIKAAGDRLWGTHLQDVDADRPRDNHWVPTQGGLDWQAIRSALQRVGYAGVWTFEVINGQKGESREELARQTRAVASAWDL